MKETRRLKNQCSNTDNKRAETDAANSDVIPNDAEIILNQSTLRWKENCLLIAIALMKGGGLNPKDISSLVISQVLTSKNPELVFIAISRQFASATQNYTFPLFPYEARILYQYIKSLDPSRRSGDCYLLSKDAEGKVPFSAEEITAFIRLELQKLQFGYASRLGKLNLSRQNGVSILLNTYRMRLEKYCGVTANYDEGALKFMVHQSLQTLVQADHYRSFTGESGQQCLYDYVRHDRRFIKERSFDEKFLAKRLPNAQVVYPCKEGSEHEVTLEVELGETETLQLLSLHGMIVSFESIA